MANLTGQLFIDGLWLEGHGDFFESLQPVTGETVWDGVSASIEDVDAAVREAATQPADMVRSAIVGAAGLAYLKFLLGQQSMIDNTLLTGIILVLFVLFLPKGLVPAIASLWRISFGRRRKLPRHGARRIRSGGVGNG
mgnify:CR=1 FL=1